MDQSSLKNSDVLILTGLTQMPTANPDGMLGEFCSNLGSLKMSRRNYLPNFFFFSLTEACIWVWPRSHDDPGGRQRAGPLLLLWSDIRPAGVPLPIHRERQPGDHALLLHLTRSQQLPGVLTDLCWVVSSSSLRSLYVFFITSWSFLFHFFLFSLQALSQ